MAGTVILGHMGEGLPISIWRIDNRNAWVKAPAKNQAAHPVAHYFHNNFYLTTSGNFRTQSRIDAMLEIGSDVDGAATRYSIAPSRSR